MLLAELWPGCSAGWRPLWREPPNASPGATPLPSSLQSLCCIVQASAACLLHFQTWA